jgi:hypothetical protein
MQGYKINPLNLGVQMTIKTRSVIIDLLILIGLMIFTFIFAFRSINFQIAPFEDAAMLMRYSEHLADGHGIVWNVGENPVDGATDFLFMAVLGLVVKIGLSVEASARVIGFTSHILTTWLIYLTTRRLLRANFLIAMITALYFCVGPGLYYVAAYFGTPFFALFGAITWYFALTIITNGETRTRAGLFAIFGLITGLIRPEGVILAGLMLAAIVFINGIQKSKISILCFLGTFIIVGGAYLIWRWQYFGFPLPNPYYKKGGGRFYTYSFKTSIFNVIRLCLPFLPAFILGFYSRKTLRLTMGFLIPIVGFASAFILISDEMNFGGRFQYVLLPIALMCWWPLLNGIKEDLRVPRWGGLILECV